MYFTVKPSHLFYNFLLQLLYEHAMDGTQLGQIQFCPILEFKLVLHATSKTTHFFSLNFLFLLIYLSLFSLCDCFKPFDVPFKNTFPFHLVFRFIELACLLGIFSSSFVPSWFNWVCSNQLTLNCSCPIDNSTAAQLNHACHCSRLALVQRRTAIVITLVSSQKVLYLDLSPSLNLFIWFSSSLNCYFQWILFIS